MASFTKGTYTVYGNRPRLFCRDVSSGIIRSYAQVLDRMTKPQGAISWLDYRARLQAYCDATLPVITDTDFGRKIAAYCHAAASPELAANRTHYQTELKKHVLNWANNGSLGFGGTEAPRSGVLGCALALDLHYSLFSSSERTTIGNKIVAMADAMMPGTSSQLLTTLDGHYLAHAAFNVIGGIAINGISGILTTSSETLISRGLDFWYGGNAAVSGNGEAAIDALRHYVSDGGHYKGGWYANLHIWYVMHLFHAIENGFSAMTVDGDTYDVWTNEAYLGLLVDWMSFVMTRGDAEFFRIGDTFKSNNPYTPKEIRTTLCGLSNRPPGDPDRRRVAAWLYETWDKWQYGAGLDNNSAYHKSMDLFFMDYNNTPPASPATFPSTFKDVQVFQPAGFIMSRRNSDIPNGQQIIQHFTTRYQQGHQDLDVGAVQIFIKGAGVILNRGYYHTTGPGGSSNPPEDFNGTHSRLWCRQSISKSGLVLFDDYSYQPHNMKDASGSVIATHSGEGGQYARKFGSDYDSNFMSNLLSDGGGLAWRNTEGIEELDVSQSAFKLHKVDARRSYCKVYTDRDTSAERVRECTYLSMIIRDQGPWDILFRLIRTESRISAIRKKIPFQFFSDPDLANFDSFGVIRAKSRTINPFLTGSYFGWAQVWVYNWPAWNAFKSGSSSFTSGGQRYLTHQERVSSPTTPPESDSLSVDSPPSQIPTRDEQDAGHWRAWVTPKQLTTFDLCGYVIIPHIDGETPPTFVWSETATAVSITFSDGKVYTIQKDGSAGGGPSNPPDTTPPDKAVISGLAAGNRQIAVSVVPQTSDASMDNGGKYYVEYRQQ